VNRAAIAIAGVAAIAAVAGGRRAVADNPLSVDNLGTPFTERVVRHRERARVAAAAGDAETVAAELVNACGAELYVTFDPGAASCTEAEAAIGPYPVVESRLRAHQSCFAAWMFRWDHVRELANRALAAGAAGPAADELAGEGLRMAHLCLGVAAIEQGAYDEAQRELTPFLASSESAGDRSFTIHGRIWLCRLATATGNRALGDENCARAIELARAGGDADLLGNASWNAGSFALETGDTAAAIAIWETGRDAGPHPFALGAMRVNLADAYTRDGRFDDADRELRALDAAFAAGALPALYELPRDAARGALLAARRDHAAAIAVLDRAAESPTYATVLYALRVRAGSQAALGQLAAAQASLEDAVARIEAARARTPGEDQRRTYMDRHAEIYRALVGVVIARGEPGAAIRALEVAEAGRARALLDAVRIAGLDDDRPGPRSVAEIQAAIGPGRTLIVYVSAEDRLFAIRATADAVDAVALPAAGTRAELAERVAYYQQLVGEVDDPAALDASGASLYADLVAPVIGDAVSGELLVSPDGPLHGLPFDALRFDGQFVIQRADVAITPSGSLLASAAAAGDARVLAIAAPVLPPDEPPLPASQTEVRALGALVSPSPTVLVGTGATKAALLAALPARYGVLHFATHATVDPTLPLRSALSLTAAAGDDGRLRADEIYRMHLDTRLVVLSGCGTATGIAAPSEGPMSLARAFLYAGAGSVVATLWDIDDRQGPPFMTRLYAHLTRGKPMAAAIGDAKRDLARAHAPPRAWAAYIVIGGAEVIVALVPSRSAAARPVRTWIALGLGVCGAACLVAAFLVRRRRTGPGQGTTGNV
jgi:CHAT domain-containing protein